MTVVYHPAATAELAEEAAYYERERPGIGRKLLADVKEAIALIKAYPLVGRIDDIGTRRVVTQRFRFIVHYGLVGSRIVVWAIAHPSREPGYWIQNRLQ